MLATVIDVVQAIFALLLRDLAGQVVAQQLREAQDGVERGAQFVRHVGEVLRLEPADLADLGVGGLQFSEVGLQLLVETAVLDRDRGLVGDDLEDRGIQLGEGIDPLPRDRHRADHPLGRGQRLDHERARRPALVEHLEARVEGGVGDVEGLELLDGVAEDAVAQDEAGDVGHHVAVRIGGGGGQLAAALVEQEDGGRIELHHLGRRPQHRFDVFVQRERCGEQTAEPVQQLNLGVGCHVPDIISHDF